MKYAFSNRYRALSSALAIALTLSAVGPAIAAAREVDVTLKSGAAYHGKLVERVPGDHITIQLVTGEVKTFAWDDIESDEGEEPTPTTKKKAPGASSPEDEGEGYYVEIKAEQPGIVLEESIGSTSVGNMTGTHWRRVCSAPCNKEVRGGSYRLRGEGLRATEPFLIDRTTRVTASLGSRGAFYGGIGALAGGLTFALVGAIFTRAPDVPTIGDYNASTGTYDEKTETNPVRTYGYVLLTLGVAAAVTGAVLLFSNTNDVTLNGKTIAKRPEWRFAGLHLAPEGILF